MKNTMSVKLLTAILAVAITIAFTPLFAAPVSAASKLKVSKSSVTVTAGKTSAAISAKGLSAKKLKKVTWSSNKTAVANITAVKGKTIKVQGIKAGTAVITAKYGKKKAKVKVTVKADNTLANTQKQLTAAKKDLAAAQSDLAAAQEEIDAAGPSVTGNFRTESYISGLIYQESAEVAALYKQAFVAAKTSLDEAIKENGGKGEGLAIVTDIDATLMDDSVYFAGCMLDAENRANLNNGKGDCGVPPWNNNDWFGYYAAVATAADAAVPGAIEFVQYAYGKGVDIYYITNRPFYELDLTVQQLINGGFFDGAEDAVQAKLDAVKQRLETEYIANLNEENQPDYSLPADNDYDYTATEALAETINNGDSGLYMYPGSFTYKDDPIVQVQGSGFSSDKKERRTLVKEAVGEKNIVMYMGDSINDMVSDKDDTAFSRSVGNAARTEAVTSEKYADKWGAEYIVMPNSAYGDWCKATWYKGKDKTYATENGVSREAGQCYYIEQQMQAHSYLNSTTWYDGPSPIDPWVQ